MAAAEIKLHRRSLAPLRDLCAQLLAEPGRARLAIALLDVTPGRPDPGDPDLTVALANVRHVAAISDPGDRRIGRLLLRREYERLADRPVLPWHLEQDLTDVLQTMPLLPEQEIRHERNP
jgi:hypothetical protein